MRSKWKRWLCSAAFALPLLLASTGEASDFIAFESDPVRPLALSSDGERLYVVNTPDARLEIFDLTRGALDHLAEVPVGLEPVAVAAHPTRPEVWVVNHLSDSISIVDVSVDPPRVTRTLLVGDEPRDIVFAGLDHGRAFVTTAHRGANAPDPRGEYATPGVGRADVWVFELDDPQEPLKIVTLFGDRPRPLAASPDGSIVYAGVYRSGNQTTGVHPAFVCGGIPNDDPCEKSEHEVPNGAPGPYANREGKSAGAPGLIVKYMPDVDEWWDELGRDWSNVVVYDLPDLDVFAIDAMADSPVEVASYPGVGTALFNMSVNPATGRLYVSNTEAVNEVRFEGPGILAASYKSEGEPLSVRGHLHEARITIIDEEGVHPRHLNKHIDYDAVPVPPGTAERSLATPTAMAVTSDGASLYVAAFGSAKIGVFDTRALEDDSFIPDSNSHIELTGGGPCGLVLDERRRRLYVLTRFDNTLTSIDTASRLELQRSPLHNPEPASLVEGRPFLYDARKTSSNGEASCAACHLFGDMDDLAWDLGNPDGDVTSNPDSVLFPRGFLTPRTFHPMKGPMTTQSLRGMANHGPLHWRGDRTGAHADPPTAPGDVIGAFKQFSGAFGGLLGRDDGPLADDEMEAFAQFAVQLTYPPNPIRRLDNSLREDEETGRDIFMNRLGTFLAGGTCNTCHVLDREAGLFGSAGIHDGFGRVKPPHLRNAYQKIGMFGIPTHWLLREQGGTDFGPQVRGYGFAHNGTTDTVRRLIGTLSFKLPVADDRANIEAFVMAFDSELAPIVGQQVTIRADSSDAALARLLLLVDRAQAPFHWPGTSAGQECELMASAMDAEGPTKWLLRDGVFESDRAGEPSVDLSSLTARVPNDLAEITFTCAPPGTGKRMALDRDRDGVRDGEEQREGTNAADPGSLYGACSDGVDNDGDGYTDYPDDPGCGGSEDHDENPSCSNGIDDDGDGRTDHPSDTGCLTPWDATETAVRQVSLDIRSRRELDHGSFAASLSHFLRGSLKVVLLGSAEVDPRDFDRQSLRFGADDEMILPSLHGTSGRGTSGPGRIRDANGDGYDDLVLRFRPAGRPHEHALSRMCVTGLITDDPFRACDSVEASGPACGLGFELVLALPLLMRPRSSRHAKRSTRG